MAEELRHVPPEPAHPMVVERQRVLEAIYRHIRDKYQTAIDKAFDSISRQIGFVVTTAVPVVLELGDKRTAKRISMGAEHLKGTLFERELTKAVQKIADDPIPISVTGPYTLYLFWFEALKLKVRADWIEPAHFRIRPDLLDLEKTLMVAGEAVALEPGAVATPVIPLPPPEPGQVSLMDPDQKALILAIDEVYPELRLADRIASYRETARRRVSPDVVEPAHFRRTEGMRPESPQELLRTIRAMLDWV